MRAMLCWVVAGGTLALSSLPPLFADTGAKNPSTTPFRLFADHLSKQGNMFRAYDNVRFEREGETVIADEVSYDDESKQLEATGNVLLVRGTEVARCSKVRLRIPDRHADLFSFELRVKASPPKDRARLAKDLGYGRDTLVVLGQRGKRRGRRSFVVESAEFSPCDCEEGAPTWSIASSRAEIDLERGAWLSWPVFKAHNVPFFALPALYVPLGDRRTGALMPRPGSSPATGPSIRQPVFFTLGESYDLTLTPTYYAWRGLFLTSDFRYAPSPSTAGNFLVDLGSDRGEFAADSAGENIRFRKTLPQAIKRFSVAGQHRSDFRRSQLVGKINFLGDPAYARDFEQSFLARQTEFSRSSFAWVDRPSSTIRFSSELSLMQDLRTERYSGTGLEPRRVSLVGSGVLGAGAVRYRALEVRARSLPTHLFSGAHFESGLAMSGYVAVSPSVPRFFRLDARPSVFLTEHLFSALLVEPRATLRMTGWSGRDLSISRNSARLAPLFSVLARSDLYRPYGAWIHHLQPEISYLLIPGVYSTGEPSTFLTNDEIDGLASVSQVRFRLRNNFYDGEGVRRLAVGAWIGSDLGLSGTQATGLSPLVFDFDARVFRSDSGLSLSVQGGLSAELESSKLATGTVGARVGHRSGHLLSLSYARYGDELPRFSMVAPEELVPSETLSTASYLALSDYRALSPVERKDFLPWSAFEGVLASIVLRPLPPLTLSFSASVSFESESVLNAVYGQMGTPSRLRTTQTRVRWDSPCRCFSVEAMVQTNRDQQGVSYNLALDLANLGSSL